MKELSIEEKAKRYDEAIKKAKSKIKDDKDHVLYEDDVIEIFPELKESEDERIRKEIISAVNIYCSEYSRGTKVREKMLAWLEKQGEQKPAGWSEKDEDTLRCIIDALDSLDIRTNTNGEHEDHSEERVWLLELKDRVLPQPKQEWSEGDEEILNFIIARLHSHPDVDLDEYSKEYNWLNYSLKFLSPQPHWKPSDEQMEALEHFIVYHNGSTNYAKDLEELRLQLKKLKE